MKPPMLATSGKSAEDPRNNADAGYSTVLYIATTPKVSAII